MAVAKTRIRDRIVRRQGILTAAGQVFIRKGFRSATMEEIADACGIGVGTLYHYFESKEAIFSSILSESTRLLGERLRAAAAKRLPPALALVAISRAYVEFSAEHPEYSRIYMSFQQQLASRSDFAREREELYGLIRANLQLFADKIREGQQAGVFRAELDPMATATALWASYSGVLSVASDDRLLTSAGLSIEKLLGATAALHFSGLSTGPAMAPAGISEGVSLDDVREVVRSVPWIDPASIFNGMHIAFQPEKARGIHEVYRFEIHGPRGGAWTVTIADGTMEVTEGAVGEPTVTIEIGDRRFVELSTGQVEGLELIVNGEMKIAGNLQRAAMFQEFFVPELKQESV